MSDVPEPIQWEQGMLLTPRHFLELGGRYEILQQDFAIAQNPLAWGVVHFEYDRRKLASGSVEITDLKVIMPDGTFISANQNDLESLSLNLSRKNVNELFLAIPRQRAFGWQGDHARYEPSRKLSGHADSIPRLRPILQLFDERPPARFVYIQLMRVKFGAAYENDFEPPRITVGSSKLAAVCVNVVESIRGKIRILIPQIRNSEQCQSDLAGFSRFSSLRARLQSLAAGLPVLETLLQASENCHPFSLYLALCSIAGHVAPMSGDLEPPDFRNKYRYDHYELLECFREIGNFICKSIDDGVPEDWELFSFEFKDGGFRLDARKELAIYDVTGQRWPVFVIGLLPSAGQSPAEVVEWGRNCVIANSGDDLHSHLSNRTTGAKREYLPNPPDPAPPPGWLMFAIDQKSPLDLTQPLQLAGAAGARPPQRADLYVRRSEKRRQDSKG
jgi:type VI secretion system protein ImpJ